jgi:predicted GTPase
LHPNGIPIQDESRLEKILRDEHAEIAVFSYSDVSHQTLMHLASRCVAVGADFWLLGTERTQIAARIPVVSICAVRTGCGKSPLSRLVAEEFRKLGWRPVVIRHPMPYGDLAKQAVQRFATMEDLDRHNCTIEEREEYEPHLQKGTVVYAGVDYEAILRQAEKEADLILWDGGNNDTPFYRSDLEIVVADPHRPGHELQYYPGEVNLRRAHVVVINKADTARAEDIETVRRNVQANNPTAQVVEMASRVSVVDANLIRGKRVLVVEDGPTLTHGEMKYGAGVVAARQFEAAEIVDPRPYAVGSIRATFEKYSHLNNLLPAMGYSGAQRHELEETIARVPCDVVLIATPVDLGSIVHITQPSVRVSYEAEERTQPGIKDRIRQFVAHRQHKLALV